MVAGLNASPPELFIVEFRLTCGGSRNHPITGLDVITAFFLLVLPSFGFPPEMVVVRAEPDVASAGTPTLGEAGHSIEERAMRQKIAPRIEVLAILIGIEVHELQPSTGQFVRQSLFDSPIGSKRIDFAPVHSCLRLLITAKRAGL